MSETVSRVSSLNFLNQPLQFGIVVGVLLGVVERFLFTFGVTSLGVAFFTLGLTLALFGERAWINVGRALAAVGLVSVIAFEALVLVFG